MIAVTADVVAQGAGGGIGWTDSVGMLLTRGGYVMIPLMLLSVVSIALIVERLIFWIAVNGKTSLRRLARLNQ
ncbi:MAG TPA: hypothetical protein QF800_00595, partial [Phycisphaerales bacterium]|nr:hypothetical protein [Phycisphaerales bacterium]